MTLSDKYEEYRKKIGEVRIDKTYDKYKDSWLVGYLYIGLLIYIFAISSFIPMLAYAGMVEAISTSILCLAFSQLYLKRYFEILKTGHTNEFRPRNEKIDALYKKLADKLKNDYFFVNNLQIFIDFSDFKLEEKRDKLIHYSVFPVILTAVVAISLEFLRPNLAEMYNMYYITIGTAASIVAIVVLWVLFVVKSSDISTHYGLKKLLIEIQEEFNKRKVIEMKPF